MLAGIELHQAPSCVRQTKTLTTTGVETHTIVGKRDSQATILPVSTYADNSIAARSREAVPYRIFGQGLQNHRRDQGIQHFGIYVKLNRKLFMEPDAFNLDI